MKEVLLIVFLLVSQNAHSKNLIVLTPQDLDDYSYGMDKGERSHFSRIAKFIKLKPRREKLSGKQLQDLDYVDIWERIVALDAMSHTLHYYPDFFKLRVEINVRRRNLEDAKHPSDRAVAVRHLHKINKLFFDYLRLYMNDENLFGKSSYAIVYATSDYARLIAEEVRGQKYCRIISFDDPRCPEVWEQSLPALTTKQ